MRDILQSRYLRSNVAHKQLARTSLRGSLMKFKMSWYGWGFMGHYYMACVCSRYNARSHWLIVTEL